MKEGVNPPYQDSDTAIATAEISRSKAVTRGVFWVFEHPTKFQEKIKHTKTVFGIK